MFCFKGLFNLHTFNDSMDKKKLETIKKKKSKANPTFDQEDEEHEITEIGKSFLTKIYTSFVVWLNACIANICIFHLILGDSAEEDLEDVPANLPKSKKKKKKKNVNPTFEELEQDDIRPDLSEK